jgi:ATP-dependent DNA ligase
MTQAKAASSRRGRRRYRGLIGPVAPPDRVLAPHGTPEAFEDGHTLLEATAVLGLEGVVAKKRSEPYRPGERGWVKTKNRTYWRFAQGLEGAKRRRRVRLTI